MPNVLTSLLQVSFELVLAWTEAHRAHDKFQLIQIIYDTRLAVQIETIPEGVYLLFAEESSLAPQVEWCCSCGCQIDQLEELAGDVIISCCVYCRRRVQLTMMSLVKG